MPDVVVIDGEEFALIEPVPGTLFDVRAHGVMPVRLHSANARGEMARFKIDSGALMLSDLQVGSVDAPPALGGVDASTDEHGQTWTYLDLDLPIEWTGDLIVGASVIADLWVHAGYAPAWHYEKVLAFDIENGMVVSSEDRSAEVAAFRSQRLGPDSPEDDEGAFERFVDSIKLRLGFSDD